MRFAVCALFLAFPSPSVANAYTQRPAAGVPADLGEVLDQHRLWLASDGAAGARADLRGVSLEGGIPPGRAGLTLSAGVVLRGRDLRKADLRAAGLRNVDLGGSNLEQADLGGSNVRWGNLAGANLRGANLAEADLRAAILTEADLHDTILTQADLSGADLTGARCLREPQLASAIIDVATKLPEFEDCAAE